MESDEATDRKIQMSTSCPVWRKGNDRYRQPEEWPWLYVFLMFTLGFFAVTNAGKSLGLDAVLVRSQPGPLKGEGLIARLYRTVT